MLLLIIMALNVLLCASCIAVVKGQIEIYYESGISIPLVCLQALFLVIAVLTWSRYSPGPWFYVGCAGFVLSSAVGAYRAWTTTANFSGGNKGMSALSAAVQLLAPLGVAVFVILFIWMMLSDWPKRKRRH